MNTLYIRKPYNIFAVASATIQGFYIYWHVFVSLNMREKIMLIVFRLVHADFYCSTHVFWEKTCVVALLVGFWIPIIFSKLDSNVFDLRNLQEQVKKAFCFKNCTDLSLFVKNVLVISKFLQTLRSEQFLKQNTITYA